MKISYIIILSALFLQFAASPASAQSRKKKPKPIPAALKIEDLPRHPIDTVATDGEHTFVVLYSNNTWEFIHPTLSSEMKDLPVYSKNWDTTQVFAYRSLELSDLPTNINLDLVDTISHYHAPIVGKVFSRYGKRGRRNHNGVDIPLHVGEPIYASFDAKVRYAKFNGGGFGYLVILRHPNGLETWHAHLSKLNVSVNDYVKSGQIIGFGGNTGRSRGPHLHFEIRYCDQTFDPERLIDFETGKLKHHTFALHKNYFNINSRASDQLEEDEDESEASLLAIGGDSTAVNVLKLPGKPSTTSVSKPSAVYHTVKSGDMLGKLASRYGVSIDQICRLNGISRTTILKLGRRLRIK